MSDPAHLADDLVRAAFSPFFEELHPHLGSEVFKTTRSRLKLEGLADVDHTQEVFSRSMAKCLEYLHKNGGGGIRQLRAWFHGVTRHEASHYVMELSNHDSGSVLSAVEGHTDLLDAGIYNPERVNAILREAIGQLPPRYREFIELDLVNRLSPPEIEQAMGINSHAYFLKLKCAAFSALKLAVKTLFEKGVSSLI